MSVLKVDKIKVILIDRHSEAGREVPENKEKK